MLALHDGWGRTGGENSRVLGFVIIRSLHLTLYPDNVLRIPRDKNSNRVCCFDRPYRGLDFLWFEFKENSGQ
jgi:hypothetical protein